MANGLLHRADCHASGTAATAARAIKGEHGPINLCHHCAGTHRTALETRGWLVERLRTNDDCDTEVVPA